MVPAYEEQVRTGSSEFCASLRLPGVRGPTSGAGTVKCYRWPIPVGTYLNWLYRSSIKILLPYCHWNFNRCIIIMKM
ncbi:hypothetical protein DERF_011487 [Dermatophagoides farinae]|uniref:Uncharacterized protein n=1 Tax=Dermatophagoides farinae TaxID=6954 RepID=A0A922KZJ8_DERFA|nr:hypothetical protein DERF_011487 [Dermatophagoides farinae]